MKAVIPGPSAASFCGREKGLHSTLGWARVRGLWSMTQPLPSGFTRLLKLAAYMRLGGRLNAETCTRINETTWFNPQQNFNGASRVLSAFHLGSLKIWYFVHLFLRRLNGLTKNLLRWGGWGLVCSIGPMNLLCFFAGLRGQAGYLSSRRA